MYAARISELMYPLDADYADSVGISTVTGAYCLVESYHRLWFELNVGEMQATATLDAGLMQSTSAAGAGNKAITGKTITQLTQAGGDGDGLVCIELQTEELDVDGGFCYVNYYITVAAAAVECSAVLYGCSSRYMPVPTTNWTEIVG